MKGGGLPYAPAGAVFDLVTIETTQIEAGRKTVAAIQASIDAETESPAERVRRFGRECDYDEGVVEEAVKRVEVLQNWRK